MNTNLKDDLTLSSRKRRIAAFLIDHFVITFLIVAVVFLVIGPNFMDENNTGKMMTIMFIVMVPGFFLYFAKDAVKGISVGKWIMGIMVRDSRKPDETPSFGRLSARNLFIVIWPVEFIVLALSQEKKRLGDKTVNTLVVMNPQKHSKLPRLAAAAGIGIVFIAFTALFAGSAVKSSEAYKVAIAEIEQHQEILTETGGIKGYGMLPTGNVSISNGYGQAQFQIKVIGNEKELNVSAYLEKEPHGEWTLIELDK